MHTFINGAYKFKTLLEKREVITALLVGFLLLPYIRTISLDYKFFNIFFIIPIVFITFYEILKKEFIYNNETLIFLLSSFFLWILIGAIYSPSKFYSFEKIIRNLICIILFFSPILIKEKKLFIKIFICSSLLILLINLFLIFFLKEEGSYNHYFLLFPRLSFLIYMLLFLSPIFNKKMFNYAILFILFILILLSQTKGVTIALFLFTFCLFFIIEAEKTKLFFKKYLFYKIFLLSIIIAAVAFFITKYQGRYVIPNFVLEGLTNKNVFFAEGSLKAYSFDEKNGLFVDGGKFHISMCLPVASFKSKSIFVRAKIRCKENSNRVQICDTDSSSYSDFHPGKNQERELNAKHTINDKSSEISIRFFRAYSYETTAFIKEVEVIDGSFEDGKTLVKVDFTKKENSLVHFTSLDNSYIERIKFLLLSKMLIFSNSFTFFTGWGTGSFPTVAFNQDQRNYPHNFIIELLIENGFIGLMFYFSFLTACFMRLEEKKNILLFISLITTDMFSSSYAEARFLFFFLGFYCLRFSKKATFHETLYKSRRRNKGNI